MRLGTKIKQLRTLKELSQLELSKLSGVPQTTISNIEKNKCTPNIDNCIKIAEALGVPIGKLLDEKSA